MQPSQILSSLLRSPIIRSEEEWVRRSGKKGMFGAKFVPKWHLWKKPPTVLASDPTTGWTKDSQRTGLIATKVGMISDWNEWNVMLPLTILQIEDNQVVQVKKRIVQKAGLLKEGESKTFDAFSLQIGAINTKPTRVTKPLLGHFEKANVPPKRVLMDFDVTQNAIIQPGTSLFARHFIAGQHVDITGITKGKGFQGPMKRWGFKGLPASHGVSVTHRSHGSTGQRQDPGRVFPGKKMAGRMVGDQRTVKNVFLWKIIPERNLLLVKGQVPGTQGSLLKIRDAQFIPFTVPPPFPTYVPKEGEVQPKELVAQMKPPVMPTDIELDDDDDSKPIAPPSEQELKEALQKELERLEEITNKEKAKKDKASR